MQIKNSIKILVVDDLDSMRLLVTQFLKRIDSVLIVGEASTADEALIKARECSPDVILMDISLGGSSGIEVTRKIKSLYPNIRIYLLSAYEVEEYRDLKLNSPGDGFIPKARMKTELDNMVKKEIERRANSA